MQNVIREETWKRSYTYPDKLKSIIYQSMPRRKALKIIVDVEFYEVTRSGVHLRNQQDVYLHVEILGQRKRTHCVPPVFPLIFQEKIRFQKVFCHATDPVQISPILKDESVRIELVQASYPVGELLAHYEGNARDFLFPTPKMCTNYPGVDRVISLTRSASFVGSSPKLEFFSRTIIKEVTSAFGTHCKRQRYRNSPPRNNITPISCVFDSYNHALDEKSPTRTRILTVKKKKPKPCIVLVEKMNKPKTRSCRRGRAKSRARCFHNHPTATPRSRTPSPYTRRRMSELATQQRFEPDDRNAPYKSDVDERPEFYTGKGSHGMMSYRNNSLCHHYGKSLFHKRRKSRSRGRNSHARRESHAHKGDHSNMCRSQDPRCFKNKKFGTECRESEIEPDISNCCLTMPKFDFEKMELLLKELQLEDSTEITNTSQPISCCHDKASTQCCSDSLCYQKKEPSEPLFRSRKKACGYVTDASEISSYSAPCKWKGGSRSPLTTARSKSEFEPQTARHQVSSSLSDSNSRIYDKSIPDCVKYGKSLRDRCANTASSSSTCDKNKNKTGDKTSIKTTTADDSSCVNREADKPYACSKSKNETCPLQPTPRL